jgi:signal transduction histidine kinase
MNLFRNLSIRAKLNLLGTLTAAIALLIACILFVANDVAATKSAMVRNLTTLAEVLGDNCIAALTFNDANAATDVLRSLQFEPSVRVAGVFDRQGQRFAVYEHNGPPALLLDEEANETVGPKFESDGTLQIVAHILDNGEQIGTVVLKSGLEPVAARFQQQLLTAVGVLFASILLSFIFSTSLQQFVSLPIIKLAETAEHVSRNRDFSVRVKKIADDEIGSLYTAFNRMLERIEAGEAELNRSHDELEERVEDRTSKLSEANEVLSHEITERKRAEGELRELQSLHIESARRAGMAEIATSVLHNVGNVLNSVNVAAAVIRDKLKKSGVADLKNVADLLSQHVDDAGTFIANDSRGKQLPRFLIQLSQKMTADQTLVIEEVKTLSENIEHIKGIVSLQQSYAGVSGMIEQLSLADLIDDAIRINSQSVARHQIEIQRSLEELPPMLTERQKVMQILVNLISNAKYAVIAANKTERLITVRMSRVGADRVRVAVIDNGIGIPTENMNRIFSHGFTTRKDGHGFGLHSAANLANEMGGSLTGSSPGTGLGATFTLELPLKTGRKSAGETNGNP